MSNNLEQIILRNLINDEKYMRKVLPFIRQIYFSGEYKVFFKYVCKYVNKYNRLPSQEAIKVELDESNISGDSYTDVMTLLPKIYTKEEVDKEWLLEKTDEWCQDWGVYNAIMESFSIIDGKHEKLTKNAIPDLLVSALGVGFDTHIGHDYFEDADERFQFYHADQERVEFDLELMNKITNGGLINKSLTILLAGTGVGKSLAMCHMAAANIAMGYDVLYITMEMSEEKIAQRIDANLLDIPISDIEDTPESIFTDKISRLKKKTSGKLIIKEYPTGQANASHFRALINDLKLKKQFTPQIIYIDYLNICASSRLRTMGGSINSYSYIKAIAEELRGLGVEFDVPIVSATQTTRSGYSSSDLGLEDTSESFGLPATADLMVALISNEELEKDGQILIKQLKNRYNDLSRYRKFLIGVNRLHMRLFDLNITAQDQIIHQVDDEAPTAEEYGKNPEKYKAAKDIRF